MSELRDLYKEELEVAEFEVYDIKSPIRYRLYSDPKMK